MNTRHFTLFFSLLLSYSIQAQQIDTEKSTVTFTVSNMKSNTVHGTLSGMQGEVRFDPSDLTNAKFDVCADATTIFTDNKKRDEHLKKEDYLHTDGFASMCFTSSSVEKTEKGFLAKGTLSLRGKTGEVEIAFDKAENSLMGKMIIDRYDYDIGGKGKFMIGREVTVTILCVLAEG